MSKIKTKIKKLKSDYKKMPKGFKHFLLRLVLFLILFKLIGFLYIDYKEFLNHSYYTTTNSYLSNFLFFVIALTLIFRKDRIKKIPNYKHSIIQSLIFGLLAIGFFSIPTDQVSMLYTVQHEMTYFAFYALGMISLFLSIFNIKFFTKFLNEEVLFITMIMIILMTSYVVVNKNWEHFFWPISNSVKLILPIFDPNVQIYAITEGFSIDMNNFKVNVGPTCAGIYSMIAFSLLFLTAIFFAKKQRNISKNKAIMAYLAGVSIMYILNIFRICTIIMVGAFYSKKLAIDLFHEYMSAIFLMGVFLIYLNKVIPKISTALEEVED